jgi:hypothetical protein
MTGQEQPETQSREVRAVATASTLVEDLSQRLTAILLNAQAMLRAFGKTPPADPEAQAVIAEISQQAFHAAATLHRLRRTLLSRGADDESPLQ